MKFLKKLKETFLALLPILVLVLFVHLFFYRFEEKDLINFIVAICAASVGEALLLQGIDSTIMPMGEMMVSSVNRASKFIVFVIFAVLFGMFATIAEPDVTIFSDHVIEEGLNVTKFVLIFSMGAGVGLTVALAIIRILKNLEIKYIYMIMFAIIFFLCTQVPNEYIAIAFDAGGATTGVITAPFLLAISTGIASKTKKNETKEVFGMVGLASLGPVIAVLLIAIFSKTGNGDFAISTDELNIYVSILKQTALAIIPIMIVFFIYDIMFIKLNVEKKLSLLIGLMITFAGLYLFLFAIDYGISFMGSRVGEFVQGLSTPFIMLFCVVIGFIITFSEPSVVVLAKQVQSVTKGNISSFVVLISMAISMAIAILISALKIIYHINFFWIILVGYLIALLFMFFVPSIFTSIAFDSGGVVSGPMTSAFLIPIMLEIASHSSSAIDGFGLIGIVAMSPIVVIQFLGMFYKFELTQKVKVEKDRALKVSYTADMYSNIIDLENEYNMLKRKKGNEK